ncbi:MAG: outer membrane protein assembly factor BamB family protein, partial [Blastococcus sp.]
SSGADPSSAVEAAGRLYANGFQGGGQVFDAATGQATGAGMFATRRPAVDAAHNVLIALQGNRITAESLADRTRYWTVTDKSIPSLSPLVANGMVITGDNSGRLLVLDEATGKQLWSDAQAFAPTDANLMQGREPAQITVGAGGLAVTSGNQLRLYAGAVDNGPTGQ